MEIGCLQAKKIPWQILEKGQELLDVFNDNKFDFGDQRFYSMNDTPFRLGECRVSVDSNFAVACFELGEKANKVLDMNAAQFETCVRGSGFDVLIVIPPAMLVLSFSFNNFDSWCATLRWGLAEAAGKIRVKEFVEKLMEGYPSLQGVFRKYLEAP